MSGSETAEQIATALSIAGVALMFGSVLVRAIPGQRLSVMADFHSPYDIHKQNYTFQLATSDIVAQNVTDGTTFTFTYLDRRYSFIVRTPKPDMTGWTKIDADLVLQENV